ncbi:RIB43A-like with coiled-coils protein 2 [Trichomycterus rosablanca]|uniref:RIB43A-like with coiled-coils protein 2 n=1 Tax=Trichomycterus rosablanca TaxID=2290929 RepID=UPI002F358023
MQEKSGDRTGGKELSSRLSLIKGSTPHPCSKGACNPLTLTLKNPKKGDSSGSPGYGNCTTVHYLFPEVKQKVVPPAYMPYRGNYTCFARSTGTVEVGQLKWCGDTMDAENTSDGFNSGWFSDQRVSRADVWWMCDPKVLRSKLPKNWRGGCALVQLVMPLYVLPLGGEPVGKETDSHGRVKRAVAGPSGSFDRHVYIDNIGVPRGVPDEFKARDQIAAGFETDGLMHNDRTACLLAQMQKKDERLQAEATAHFRNQFQQPSSRREFDLNDPDLLKKQAGVRILPGLTGEDLSSRERARRQREQMRDWTLQQQQELEEARDLQKMEDQQYDQSRVELDNKALELQSIEEELKKTTNIAVKDFNQALAAEKQELREKERLEEEENNRTEILNHLQGELLNEKTQWNTRVPGLPQPRRDCYKGMTPEQLRHYTDFQLQQAEQKTLIRMEQKEEQLQQDRIRMASARALLLQERHQARINKELRRAVDQTNMHLAQIQHTQRKKEVYTNIPDESFFSQFNTSSR